MQLCFPFSFLLTLEQVVYYEKTNVAVNLQEKVFTFHNLLRRQVLRTFPTAVPLLYFYRRQPKEATKATHSRTRLPAASLELESEIKGLEKPNEYHSSETDQGEITVADHLTFSRAVVIQFALRNITKELYYHEKTCLLQTHNIISSFSTSYHFQLIKCTYHPLSNNVK